MRHFFLAALIVVLGASCNKYKDYTAATVRDSGDISLGGCGYLLDVEDVGEQRPQSLPSAYMHPGMRVWIKYRQTGVYDTCGNKVPYSFHELIAIDDIQRRD